MQINAISPTAKTTDKLRAFLSIVFSSLVFIILTRATKMHGPSVLICNSRLPIGQLLRAGVTDLAGCGRTFGFAVDLKGFYIDCGPSADGSSNETTRFWVFISTHLDHVSFPSFASESTL